MGEDFNICIQFDLDIKELEIDMCDINEYEMSNAYYNDIIDTIFGY